MKRLLLSALILVGGFTFTLAQSSSKVQPNAEKTKVLENSAKDDVKETEGPQMKFKSKTIDYGEIEENSDPYRYFQFTNTGTDPLLITSAKGSCGCTVPTYPTEPIGAGESGEIKVRYATNRIGPFKKTVTLTTNTKEGTITLTIKGKVHKKAEESEAIPGSEKNMFKSN